MRGRTLSRADIERIFRLSRSNVYDLLNRAEIPGGRYGSGWEINGTVLADWIAENMVRRRRYQAWQLGGFRSTSIEEWRHQPEWMTVPEVVALTGFSRPAMYRMVKKGEVPGTVRIGGQWHINRDALTRWIFAEPG